MGVTTGFPSPSWTPTHVEWRGDEGRTHWCYTNGFAFDDPFFDETIERCLRHPFRLLFQPTTSVDDVVAYADALPSTPTGGLVFHESRCGSTLVAQMLAAVPGHRVLSEAGPLDDALRGARHLPEARRRRVFTSLLAALGHTQPRASRVFVKFDAWTTLELAEVRASLPDVPWLFLYRDPVEVLDSHARRLGAHTVRGALPAADLGVRDDQAAAASPIEFAARVLARICEAALDHRDDPLATFVHYRQLPQFVLDDLAHRWDFPIDASARRAMEAAAARDAKNPAIAFDPQRPRLRESEHAAVVEAAEKWLAPSYAALEEARAEHEARR